jgi:DNA-binding NtrC family response regulator
VASSPHTVLVVDDDESMRMLCRVNLALAGYRVLEASTVESGRELLNAAPVDVVLLDVHVGAGDGFTLLDAMTSQRVVLFTGSLEVESVHRDRVDAVLTKPFTLDELHETIDGLVTA